MARQDLQLGSRAKVRTLSTGKTKAKVRAIEVATVTEWLCSHYFVNSFKPCLSSNFELTFSLTQVHL